MTEDLPYNFIKNIIDNSEEIVYVFDQDGFYVFVSKRWEQVLGHPVHEVIGRNVSEFVHKKDLKKCLTLLNGLENWPNDRGCMEYRIRHKTDGWQTHRSNVTKTIDNDSQAQIFVGSCIDITKKLKIKKAIKQEKQKFKLLVENLDDFIYSCTIDGHFTYLSPKCLELGYPIEELIGAHYSKIVHPDFHELIYNYQLDVFTGKPNSKSLDIILICKNGEENWYTMKGNFLQTTKKTAESFIGTAVNITEKVNEAKQSQVQIENFKNIFEQSLGGYWEWNLDEQSLFLSAQLKTKLGYSSKDYVNIKANPLVDVMNTDEFEIYWKSLKSYIASDPKTAFRHQINFNHKKGQVISTIMTGIVVERQGKLIKKMIGCLIDITDKVQESKKLTLQIDNFKSIFEQALDGFWEWDVTNHDLVMSQRLKAKLGYAENDYNDCSINPMMEVMETTEFTKFWSAIIDFLKFRKQQSFVYNAQLRHRDGHYLSVIICAIITESDPLRVRKLMGCVVDISEISNMKNVLEQKNVELQMITEREQKATKDVAYQIMLGQEHERNLIAQELHDGINQMLFASKIQLQESISKSDKLFQNGISLIDKSINEIKYIATSQKSFLMFNKTLYDALNELILSLPNGKIDFKLTIQNKMQVRISDNKRVIVLRIVQELIHNTLKYSKASQCHIFIKKTPEKLSLMVSDNGIGFDLANIKKGNGLNNLENKVKIIDGMFRIKAQKDRGAIFYINFPT